MEYAKFGSTYVLRLEIGEDISEKLLELARREDIALAEVTGLGATDDFTVGVFNLERRAYDELRFTGNHEITALTGNLTRMDSKPYAHLHISCADASGQLRGGHLLRARISLTAEIIVRSIRGNVDRRHDEEHNINLMSFSWQSIY